MTATHGGAPVSFLSLVVESETRGEPALPVLSENALARRVLRPAGPGSATVLVSAGPERTARLTVSVAPTGPTVFAASTTAHGTGSDTTVLHGVQLGALSAAAVRVDGAPVTLYSQSSTELRFAAPPSRQCSAASAVVPLDIAGATVSPEARLHAPGGADLELQVGAWRTLSRAEASCIRLPAGNAEYAVAYADVGPIDASKRAYASPPWATFNVAIADRTSGAGQASPSLRDNRVSASARSRGARRALHEPHGVAAADEPARLDECSDHVFLDFRAFFWCRSKPWAVGDTMVIRRPHVQTVDTVRATVYAIHGGTLAFAAIDGDNSPDLLRFKATIDSVLPAVVQHTLPLLRSVFGPAEPTTSQAAGQLLTIIGDFEHGSVGQGCCDNAGGPWSAVTLGSTLAAPRAEMFYLLSHEITHAYQRRWMHDSRPPGASPFWMGAHWGIEGSADLIAYERCGAMQDSHSKATSMRSCFSGHRVWGSHSFRNSRLRAQ